MICWKYVTIKVYFIGYGVVILSRIMWGRKVCAFTLSIILLLQIVSFGGSSNSFIPKAEAIEYLTYENPTNGFKIDYPSNWIAEEKDEIITQFILTGDSVDETKAGFLVATIPLKSEDAKKIALNQMTDAYLLIYGAIFPDLQINQKYESVIDRMPAEKIEFSTFIQGTGVSGILMITIKDEMSYGLFFLSESKEFRDFKKIALKMVDSFKIVEPSTLTSSNVGELGRYHSSLFGFSIDYPNNWYVDDIVLPFDDNPGIYESAGSFLFLTDGSAEFYDYSIWVDYYKKFNRAILHEGQDYLDEMIDGEEVYCKDAVFDWDGFECSNHLIINSEIIKIDGKQAYQVTETWTETYPSGNSVEKYIIVTDIVDGSDIWEIIFLNPASGYSNFAITINEIIQSFKVDEGSSPPGSTIPEDITDEIVSSATIPDWIRNNAEWWAQGAIGDSDFVSGIQYLIKEGIIQIPETEQTNTANVVEEIPSWIKNNAEWWAQGLISDDDFVKGIQYLVENGIIVV